jgi:hypothetical protein
LRDHHPATSDRFDGGAEMQSRTTYAGNQPHCGQGKASQARSRSAPAIIASTAMRSQLKEFEALKPFQK